MSHSEKLHTFSIRLAICNVDETVDTNVVQDLTDEISMRPHLKQQSIQYDHSLHRVAVQLSLESFNIDLAAKQMAEELFEISNAILRHVDGVRIEVLDAFKREQVK